MTLLDRVAAILTSHHIEFALIGASALAVHGVSRSTVDRDLLVVNSAVLDAEMWAGLGSRTEVDVRRGTSDDPLLGVVRLRLDGDRDVDIVVGRDGWQRNVLTRARPMTSGTSTLPVVDAADLILLKLYAGGSQDRWDIEQLLGTDAVGDVTRAVDDRLPALPARCRAMWDELRRT